MGFSLSLSSDMGLDIRVAEPAPQTPTAATYSGLVQWFDCKATPATVLEADAGGNISLQWNNSVGGAPKASQGVDLNVPDFTQRALSTPQPGIWFDGNDHLALASTVTLTGAFTVLMVVERRQTTAADTLIGGSTGANHLRWNASSTTAFDVRINGATDTFTLPATAAASPHIIAVTRNSSDEIKVWKAKTAATENGTPPTGAGDFVLTHIGSDNSAYHDGIISEIAIYNVELSDANREALTDAWSTKWINIGLVGDATPVAVADAFSVIQGGTFDTTDTDTLDSGYISVLGNDTGMDDAPITVTVASGGDPTRDSAFTLNSDGTFSYTNDGVSADNDSFTYRATDRDGNWSEATVTIMVVASPTESANPGIVRLPIDMTAGKTTGDTGGIPAVDYSSGGALEMIVYLDNSLAHSSFPTYFRHGALSTWTGSGAGVGFRLGTRDNSSFLHGHESRDLNFEVKTGAGQRVELDATHPTGDFSLRSLGWRHVFCTFDATWVRIFVDGVKLGETSASSLVLGNLSAVQENIQIACGRALTSNLYDLGNSVTPDISVAAIRTYAGTPPSATEISTAYNYWQNTGLVTQHEGATAYKWQWTCGDQVANFAGDAGTGYLKEDSGDGVHLEVHTISGASNPWPTTGVIDQSGSLTMVAPADLATGIETHPIIRVTGTTGNNNAPYYEIEVDTANTFDTANLQQSGTLWLHGEWSPLLAPSTLYYMRARVREGPAGTPGAWATTISWTTRAATNHFVRSKAGGPYGTGDGSSNANAWDGSEQNSQETSLAASYTKLQNRAFYPGVIGPGDELRVSGNFEGEGLSFCNLKGTSANPITITCLDATNPGVLTGEKQGTFSGAGPIYNIAHTGSDNIVVSWDSTADGIPDTILNEDTGQTLASAGWYIAADVLYVRTTDDTDPSNKIWLGGKGHSKGGIRLHASCDELVIKPRIICGSVIEVEHDHNQDEGLFAITNIRITAGTIRGQATDSAIEFSNWCDGWEIDNNTITNVQNGIYTFRSGGAGQHGAEGGGVGSANGPDSCHIHDNTISTVGVNEFFDDTVKFDGHNIGIQHGSSNIVEYNTCTDSRFPGIEFWTNDNRVAQNNICRYNTLDQCGQTNADNNWTHGLVCSGTPEDNTHDIDIIGNVVTRSLKSGIRCNWPVAEITYNVIGWCGEDDVTLASLYVAPDNTVADSTLEIKNNLVIANPAAGRLIGINPLKAGYTLTIDGNAYWLSDDSSLDANSPEAKERFYDGNRTGNNRWMNTTEWQSYGHDTNGVFADPKIVDKTGTTAADTLIDDATSPLIDAAVATTTAPADDWQKAGSRDAPRDIGGAEYVGGLPTTNLILHLDASITGSLTGHPGIISKWADQSTSSNDANQTNDARKPDSSTKTQNSLTVLDWDGSNDVMNISAVIGAGAFTVYLVLKRDSTAAQHNIFGISDQSTGMQFRANDTQFRVNATDFNGMGVGTTNAALIRVTRDGSDNVQCYKDGVESSSGAQTIAGALDCTRVGGTANSGTNSLQGMIAEIAVYSALHSAGDISTSETHLQSKWATPALP